VNASKTFATDAREFENGRSGREDPTASCVLWQNQATVKGANYFFAFFLDAFFAFFAFFAAFFLATVILLTEPTL